MRTTGYRFGTGTRYLRCEGGAWCNFSLDGITNCGLDEAWLSDGWNHHGYYRSKAVDVDLSQAEFDGKDGSKAQIIDALHNSFSPSWTGIIPESQGVKMLTKDLENMGNSRLIEHRPM